MLGHFANKCFTFDMRMAPWPDGECLRIM
jgi:hypothetical protein